MVRQLQAEPDGLPFLQNVARKVSRDIDEDVRDQVRALANTEAFQISRRERKKVEVRFAHMKRIHKLDRLRLRGLSGVKDEVLLTATAQNLRRLAKLIWHPPQPPMRQWRRRPAPLGVGADRSDAAAPAMGEQNHEADQKSTPSPTTEACWFCNTLTPRADTTQSIG